MESRGCGNGKFGQSSGVLKGNLFLTLGEESSVTNYDCIPDLLEQYMTETGTSEQWITVRKFRQYFQLSDDCSHSVSGFLYKIYKQPFSQFPYVVARIERVQHLGSYHLRYYVKLRDDQYV
jgi:hypothetical protein